jgi:diacylglycerol kinase (ATP)
MLVGEMLPSPSTSQPALRRRPSPPYPQRRSSAFWDSLLHAWNGLLHTVVHQRNMRVHLVCAILVGLVGSGIPLGLAEKVTMVFCVLLIFFAEILNSAIEQMVDLAVQQFDEKARLAKDAGAAGVLVLAMGTVVIFAAILVYNWGTVTSHGGAVGRQFALGIPLAACASLLVMDRRKPPLIDRLLFAGACALFAAAAVRSTSYVFSAMTFGLLLVANAAARARRRERAN